MGNKTGKTGRKGAYGGIAPQKQLQLSQKALAKIDEVFALIDTDKSGTIDQNEILDAFTKANGRASKGIRFFNNMDIQKAGGVTKAEFKQFWAEVLNSGTSEQSIMTELESLTDQTTFTEQLQRISAQQRVKEALLEKVKSAKTTPIETREQKLERLVQEQVDLRFEEHKKAWEAREKKQQDKFDGVKGEVKKFKASISELFDQLEDVEQGWETQEFDDHFKCQAKLLTNQIYSICSEIDVIQKESHKLRKECQAIDFETPEEYDFLEMQIELVQLQEEADTAVKFQEDRLTECMECDDCTVLRASSFIETTNTTDGNQEGTQDNEAEEKAAAEPQPAEVAAAE